MANELLGIGIGAASNLAGGLLGIGAGQQAAQQQFHNQQMLNIQAHELSKKMWDYTNYENQRKHMEKAGLNVGLMYGQGGGGGSTTASTGSGGSAGMAPQYALGLGLDPISMANIELIKAQTEKTKAEATKIEGVDTDLAKTQISNLNANTGNTEADTIIKGIQATGLEIDNYIKNNVANFEIEQAELLSGKLSEELKNLQITNYVDKATAETSISQAKANLATTYIQQEATKAGIKLTKEQTRAISQELAQGWEELSLKVDSNNIQHSANKIKLLEAKIYKALGEESNALTRRGQNLQLGQNVFGILKGRTTTKKGYSDTKGRYEETIKTN